MGNVRIHVTYAAILLCFLLPISSSVGYYRRQLKRSVNTEYCFCELNGKVDECCCDVEAVEELVDKLHPQLQKLLLSPYFRFFRIALDRPCPFWTENGGCVLKGCSVSPCDEKDVPTGIKAQSIDGARFAGKPSCSREQELSSVDGTISDTNRRVFSEWRRHDASDSFCHLDEENSTHLEYVDLTINPERYTGYRGESTHRIWNAIYRENCFRPKSAPAAMPFIPSSMLSSLCREKRAYYRIVSGLHASINVHLCAKYQLGLAEEFGPNQEEFAKRFDPSTTNGEGPQWLKNLYFTFLMVLRAVIKAENLWRSELFYTGDGKVDRFVKEQVTRILASTHSCPSTFDETMMFTSESAPHLKREVQSHFKNISLIMDCVGCQRCRLWGKLQVQGLGTAMKILFNGEQYSSGLGGALQRTEIVALFNTLGRLADSINSLKVFRRPNGDAGKPRQHADKTTEL
ncbi:ero1-like protein isoform X2 [Sycon ciliatum]|uniref:ero1-like protein isoform X2 n=1 Tax=Sycon ciliatum TaxID=27933 RepID=UPI0031F6AD5E